MANNAYIKLVPASEKQNLTTDELKELFNYYQEITTKTGTQLGWDYGQTAFPYELIEQSDSHGKWFHLSSTVDRYYAILIGVDQEKILDEEGTEREQSFIQITLTEASTAGDKGKANEFCKYLAKKLKGELHLFNGRIMYFYPRK
jgi:hypothetical protein